MGAPKGTQRSEPTVARARVSLMKTCLRNKAAKHQRDIELQLNKIRAAEAELAALEAKESE